uniref:RGS domain-containing protein n=1 Tax=Macrostomum lignano TaxID=282301 RepID=A0A1I8JSD3_9PLAT
AGPVMSGKPRRKVFAPTGPCPRARPVSNCSGTPPSPAGFAAGGGGVGGVGGVANSSTSPVPPATSMGAGKSDARLLAAGAAAAAAAVAAAAATSPAREADAEGGRQILRPLHLRDAEDGRDDDKKRSQKSHFLGKPPIHRSQSTGRFKSCGRRCGGCGLRLRLGRSKEIDSLCRNWFVDGQLICLDSLNRRWQPGQEAAELGGVYEGDPDQHRLSSSDLSRRKKKSIRRKIELPQLERTQAVAAAPGSEIFASGASSSSVRPTRERARWWRRAGAVPGVPQNRILRMRTSNSGWPARSSAVLVGHKKQAAKAQKIYNEFVAFQAPRELLDLGWGRKASERDRTSFFGDGGAVRDAKGLCAYLDSDSRHGSVPLEGPLRLTGLESGRNYRSWGRDPLRLTGLESTGSSDAAGTSALKTGSREFGQYNALDNHQLHGSIDKHLFEQAQKRIQALMEKDSYQRFLRSEVYLSHLNSASAASNRSSGFK